MRKDNLECIKNFEPITDAEFERVEKIERQIRELSKQISSFRTELRARIQAALAYMTEVGELDGFGVKVSYDASTDNIVSYGEQSDNHHFYWITTECTLDYNHSEDYAIPTDLIFANDLETRFTLYKEAQAAKKASEERTKNEETQRKDLEAFLELKKKLEEGGWKIEMH